MTNDPQVPQENTPRTRNRIKDNTFVYSTPEGYTKGKWTERTKTESNFRALGFRSQKLSHKKEPDNRRADSLLLSWVSDSKDRKGKSGVEWVEVSVTYGESSTIFDVFYYERRYMACTARKQGKIRFTDTPSEAVLGFVTYLLDKPAGRDGTMG